MLCVCARAYPSIVARQRFGKHVPEATNTYPAVEEFLDASFCMSSVSYQRKTGNYLFSLVMGPNGARKQDDCADENQHQFTAMLLYVNYSQNFLLTLT
jgi:hypothetical protein